MYVLPTAFSRMITRSLSDLRGLQRAVGEASQKQYGFEAHSGNYVTINQAVLGRCSCRTVIFLSPTDA